MNAIFYTLPSWKRRYFRFSFSLFLIALMGLVSCKSTKNAFKRGEYETAVFNSIEKLRKSPENKKALEILDQAYPLLKEYHVERVQTAKMSTDPLRWEEVVASYALLNKAYDEVQRAPAAKRLLPGLMSYTSELRNARQAASEARYALAEEDLGKYSQQEDREFAKRAYEHFQKALELTPGFRDAEIRREEARELATLFVEIRPIPMHSRSLSLSNEFFENQLTEFIREYPTSPFIQFVRPGNTTRSNPDVDQIIQMKFDDFVVGQVAVKEKVVQRRNDSLIVAEEKISEDSVNIEYGEAEVEVHQFQKVVNSSGLLDFQIIDARTGSVISQKKFPGTFVYYDYWGFFNGDKRALHEEDDKYLSKGQANPDPLPQDLFIELTKPIFDQVTSYVADYYRGY